MRSSLVVSESNSSPVRFEVQSHSHIEDFLPPVAPLFDQVSFDRPLEFFTENCCVVITGGNGDCFPASRTNSSSDKRLEVVPE